MSVRDVAARAGVSPATVSRVFTQPDVVSIETRRRVLAVAEELRYVPHPVARSLARGRTGNLGIVVPDIANAFSSMITKAVQQEARRDGYALFVAGSDELPQDELEWARAMAPQVDGLLLVSPLMPDGGLAELADVAPVVLVNRELDGIPAVLTDTAEATGHAVEHLHALGHREILYLAGPTGYSNSMRLRGYREACARLGIEAAELGPFNARFSAGIRAADLVLATSATAVVAYNDEVAVGVINRLADRGVRVPHDISIVGYDDTSLAEMVTPRLTTVRLPMEAVGRTATRMLLDAIDGRDNTAPSPLALPAELIIRNSTGQRNDLESGWFSVTDPALRHEGAPERRTWILAKLRAVGFLSISDLTRQLGVSHMTVRRDIHALEATGHVRMVHGGVCLTPDSVQGRTFPDDGNADGRARVADHAVELVGPADTIVIDAGPTAYALVRALPDDFRGSVITHSMPVLRLLDERALAARTVALGGELDADRHAFVGPATEAAIGHLRARTFFLSPSAVDARGTYACSPAEASVQRKLMDIADDVVLVATHEVFSTSAPACVAPLDHLTSLVTDRPPPNRIATSLRRSDVIAHVVDR